MDMSPAVSDFQNRTDGDRRAAAIRKRSVTLAGHATSVTLEDAFWEALAGIAAERGLSLNALIAEIDDRREGNLSSACRVYVLQQLRARVTGA